MGFIKDKQDDILYSYRGLIIKNPNQDQAEELLDMIEKCSQIINTKDELKTVVSEDDAVKIYRYVFKNMSNQPYELDDLTDKEVLDFFRRIDRDIVELRIKINDMIQTLVTLIQETNYNLLCQFTNMATNLKARYQLAELVEELDSKDGKKATKQLKKLRNKK